MSLSPSPQPPARDIDRQKTTPFLLNLCYRSNAFHNLADFQAPTPSNTRPQLPQHLQIYTWYSCTLKELALLLTTALPSVVPDPPIGTRLSFRLIYPDSSPAMRGGRLGAEEGRGRYTTKEMGSIVIASPESSNGDTDINGKSYELGGEDNEKTLVDAKFVIGDVIDCAIFAPLSDGSVVPRGIASGNRGGFTNGRGRGASSYGLGRGAIIPMGEWRRGERIPESAGGSRGGGGGYARGPRRGPY